MSIQAGKLVNRITFQSRAEAQDGTTGAITETWADDFTCWADVSPLRGRELLAAAQMQSSVTHTITVRYRSELANPNTVAAMRILFGTRVFNIHASMNQDEHNRAVTLMAEEGIVAEAASP